MRKWRQDRGDVPVSVWTRVMNDSTCGRQHAVARVICDRSRDFRLNEMRTTCFSQVPMTTQHTHYSDCFELIPISQAAAAVYTPPFVVCTLRCEHVMSTHDCAGRGEPTAVQLCLHNNNKHWQWSRAAWGVLVRWALRGGRGMPLRTRSCSMARDTDDINQYCIVVLCLQSKSKECAPWCSRYYLERGGRGGSG